MKLISLNTWGGIAYKPLVDFILKYATDTDIFCFQEMLTNSKGIKTYERVRANLLQDIARLLPDFDYSFVPVLTGSYIFNPEPGVQHVDFDLTMGLAIFWRHNLKVDKKGSNLIYAPNPDSNDFSITAAQINLQYLKIEDLTVFNFHGAPFPRSKLDTPFRIEQSNKIKKVLENTKGTKILVGDFNLMPETESITILDSIMRNLIKEYKIEKTRSRLNLVNGKPGDQKYADFTFVTEDVQVKSFEVPDMEISDHLPMILQFSTPLT